MAVRRGCALLLALAAGVGGAMTAASPAFAISTSPGSIVYGDYFCSFRNWGGDFYCPQGARYQDTVWKKPDGYVEVFVIGMDSSVWTRWAGSRGVSSWTNMGGVCMPNEGLMIIAAGWTPGVICTGSDWGRWALTRNSDGSWNDWRSM